MGGASHDEVPLFFASSEGECLFGVLTAPSEPNGVAAILLWGGGLQPSSGRNQVRTTLARRLAGEGYHVLRMDYHGAGESTGTAPAVFRLDRPFVSDAKAAVDVLRGMGFRRFVLVGTCFGSRTALACATDIDGLEAVALIAAPTRNVGHREKLAAGRSLRTVARQAVSRKSFRRLRNRERRAETYRIASEVARATIRRAGRRLGLRRDDHPPRDEAAVPVFRRAFAKLVDRGTQMLLIYGTGDDFYPDFELARTGELGRSIDRAGARAQVVIIDARVHGFRTIAVQQEVIDVVTEWMAKLQTGAEHPAGDRVTSR